LEFKHCVRKSTDVVDVAVQYDPAHAVLPWTGNADMVEALSVHGGDRMSWEIKKGPPLAITIHGKCNSVLSLLLDHGANAWQPFSTTAAISAMPWSLQQAEAHSTFCSSSFDLKGTALNVQNVEDCQWQDAKARCPRHSFYIWIWMRKLGSRAGGIMRM
jgi:hypothetical protein